MHAPGRPAFYTPLKGGEFDRLPQTGEEIVFPLEGASDRAPQKVGGLLIKGLRNLFPQEFPALLDPEPSLAHQVCGRQLVRLLPVDLRVDGKQVPQVVAAPQREGNDVVDGKVVRKAQV